MINGLMPSGSIKGALMAINHRLLGPRPVAVEDQIPIAFSMGVAARGQVSPGAVGRLDDAALANSVAYEILMAGRRASKRLPPLGHDLLDARWQGDG